MADGLRPCLDCRRPSRAAHCGCTGQTDNRRRAEKSKAHGLTKSAWRARVRPAVLTRDGHRCQLRLERCTGRATTVHRRPEFGTAHDENLDAYVSACASCHGVVDGARAHR